MKKRQEMQHAKAIAASSRTALGPVPATRVLRQHLPTILEWRSCGASWDQIATILSAAGWRSKKDGIVSAPTLRAMVSRISRSQLERPRHADAGPRVVTIPPGPHPSGQTGSRSANPARSDIAGRIQRAAALRSGKSER